MQDMATMQHTAVTSPNPAPPPQDSSSTNGDEIHQETSRTDQENRDDGHPMSGAAEKTNAKDLAIKRDSHKVDLKCQNNNEVNENNGNTDANPTDLSKTNGVAETQRGDASDSDHEDAKSSTASEKMETSQDGEADDRSDSEMKYVCPICDKMLSSQHDFTLHIRSHNNNDGVDATEVASNLSAKGYACKICSKVLSSSSSLDRHVLVHSGERPFKCRVCAVAFTTNGNMHRHMRTHNSPKSNDYESDGSSDSGTSLNQNGKSPASPIDNNNGGVKKRRIVNESDASPEANNNKRKMDEIVSGDCDPIKRRLKGLGGAQDFCAQQKFQCPVCEREDFASLNVLETHLESTHPDYKIRCRSCDLDFKNHRVLNLHRFMVHHDKETTGSLKASVLGFKDLTFMDFSSEKFPHIARAVCEQKLHQASSAQHNFQCDKCSRAFPCSSALAIHQQACYEGTPSKKHHAHSVEDDSPTDLSQRTTPTKDRVSSDEEEEEKKREDFFAGLDLQNKSAPTSPQGSERREKPGFESGAYFHPEAKDLADIQSMISVTNAGGLRLQDLTKSPVVNGSLTPSDKSFSDANEEEQQDCFAAEFRKMKLKGEFPCRLCSSVFPNLRALKGHNRAHLVSGNIFRCNMCPYSNADKAILIRHMRSHNGDRPYECGLCNYAFTTKANCERHLRNRHSKLGRDEVKKSIIYHPSEDPTNDIELQAKIQSVGSDVKRALTFNNSTEDLTSAERYEERYQNRITREKLKMNFERSERFDRYEPERRSPGVVEAATMTSQNGDDSESDDSGNNSNDDMHLVNHAFNERQRMNARQRYSPNNNSPLDLSMDVLDLSKKATPTPTPTPMSRNSDLEPQDLSKKSSPPEYNNNVKLLKVPNLEKSHLQAQLLARPQSPSVAPKIDVNVANFYASNPHPMFINNNGFPFPGQPFLNPYFMAQQHPMGLLPELIRGLQMSGGTMLDPMVAADTLQHLHQQAMAEYARKEMKFNEVKAEERPVQEEKVVTNVSKLPKQLVPPPKPRERDNSSVKMVIKNGVLMPKQKQRRYRTERPFFCEHCSARFTLRSNMERHIKQQHPEFWTQRQRGNVAGGRRNPSLSSHSQENSQNTHESKVDVNCGNSKPLGLKIPNHIVNNFSGSFDMTPKHAEDAYDTKDKHNLYTNNNNNNINNNNNNKPFISDEVKLAISQQLKSKLNHPTPKPAMDDAEEDELVIDEEDSKADDKSVKDAVEDNINKRSETPKRDASFEEGYKSFKDTFFRGIKSDMKDNVYRPVQQHVDLKGYLQEAKERGQLKELERRKEESVDLASVSRLIDNATNHTPAFQRYFRAAQDHDDEVVADEPSDEDEEGLVAPSDNSGSDENRSDVDNSANKKKSAYSLAPNRVSCPYCHRKFPWSSSLRRHVLTHTGQKPFKCAHCPLLFTTKSNCDRHLLRKHANTSPVSASPETSPAVAPTAPHSSYTMRNVPERPYKCNYCPSSTFSTLSNLNKHLSAKHPNPLAPKAEDVVSNEESCSEEEDDVTEVVPEVKMEVTETRDPTSTSDLPFKCHLCEGSYGERQEALEHIKENHPTEFVLLMSKGALENGVEDNNNGHEEVAPGEESLEQLRGKFPDYANRKVMCAFCLRRFWSAEDLRRHMRTHTGERPFSCDICRRRFTLKHSMLRHRKKHSATDASPPSPGDDEKHSDVGVVFKPNLKTQTYNENNFKEYMMKNNAGKHQDKILKGYMAGQLGKNEQMYNHFVDNNGKMNGFLDGQNGKTKSTNHNNNNIMSPTAKGLGSRYIMENPWPAVREAVEARSKFGEEKREGVEDETDLIGNLLGIQDKSIIDKMLVSKSADDAAKLLGVGNRE